MEKVRLGDVATVITKGTTPTSLGYDFIENGINFVKIESITEDGDFIKDKFAHITDECNEKLNRSQLQENDILFSIAGAIGRVAIVDKSILPANTNQALAIIRVPKGIYEYNFLKYILKSPVISKQFEKQKQGVAQINLSLKNISDFEIPVISLEQQRQVSLVLDKVNDLISKRKEQLKKLDELVKARFVELFGTPLLNEKGWETRITGDVCSVTDGSHFSPVGKEKGYPMLSVRNMRNDGFHYDDCKLVSQEDYDVLVKQGCKPLKNDVLIAKDGSYFYYGFVVKEEIEQAVLSSIAILRPNLEEINPEYLCRYMLSSEIVDLVGKNYVTGAAIKRVILKGIKQIPVMLPPIELQNQFAAFVEQTDKSKLEVQKSLEKLELLKKALMQKYFG